MEYITFNQVINIICHYQSTHLLFWSLKTNLSLLVNGTCWEQMSSQSSSWVRRADSDRPLTWIHLWEWERERERVCVCVCEWERKCLCAWESEWVRERERLMWSDHYIFITIITITLIFTYICPYSNSISDLPFVACSTQLFDLQILSSTYQQKVITIPHLNNIARIRKGREKNMSENIDMGAKKERRMNEK